MPTVRTPTLEIGYEEWGDAAGAPVVLLHGFPDDAHAWNERGASPGRPRLPRPRPLPARLRAHALPRRGRPAHGAAGRDRPGPAGLPGRARHRAGRARRLRLGWARGLHHRHPGAGARARPPHHRRLQRPEHDRDPGARLRAAGAGQLVPVVLQHRARAPRARAEPPRDLPAALAGLVAGLALRRRDVRAGGGRLRQPRLRPGGDPLLPASAPPRAGRAALRRDRAPPRRAAAHRGAERDPARPRRRGGPPAAQRAAPRPVPGRDPAACDPGRRSLPPARAARRGRGGARSPCWTGRRASPCGSCSRWSRPCARCCATR